jgi:hypothetical protein
LPIKKIFFHNHKISIFIVTLYIFSNELNDAKFPPTIPVFHNNTLFFIESTALIPQPDSVPSFFCISARCSGVIVGSVLTGATGVGVAEVVPVTGWGGSGGRGGREKLSMVKKNE